MGKFVATNLSTSWPKNFSEAGGKILSQIDPIAKRDSHSDNLYASL